MTLETQTEEPLMPLSDLDGAKGLARVARDAVLHPIPLGGVVAAVVVAVAALGMWRSSGDSDHGTRRWDELDPENETGG
jgi:hypothetical protein